MIWTIGKKLNALTFAGIAFVALMGGAGYYGSLNIGRGMDDVATTATALQQHMEGDMMHDAIRADVLASLVAEDQAARDDCSRQLQEHADNFHANLDANDALPLAPEVKQALQDVKPELVEYIKAADLHVKMAFEDKAMAMAKYPEFLSAFEELEEKLGLLSELIDKNITKAKNEQIEAVSDFRSSLLVLLLVFVPVLFILSKFIGRGITKPLNALLLVLKDISQGAGDLTVRVDLNRKDEIGELASSFNTFVEKIQRIVQQVMASTDSLSTSSAGLATTSEGMSSGAVRMSEQSQSAASISESTAARIQNVAASTEEVSSNSTVVASAAEEVSSNLTTVSAAVEEVSASMESIADSMGEMSNSVGSVAAAVEEMSSSLAEVSHSTSAAAKTAGEATDQANAAAKTVHRLGEAANQIDKVVDLIKGIAAQTNLLALNATIEAASAGEAGKGFAVVANEVKELAKQTASATEEIRAQIEDMQLNTGQAVTAINGIVTTITDLNQAFGTTARMVEEQNSTINEIARNIGRASAGADEVTRSVQQAAMGSSEVARNVQEATSGVNEIARNVSELALGANSIAENIGEASRGMSDVADIVDVVNGTAAESKHGADDVKRAAAELAELSGRLKQLMGQFSV